MPVPYAIARFNKRWTNRFIEPIVRTRPGFAVVHHTGRRSGRDYATPVKLFASGADRLVVLTYGRRADWVQNVLAHGGSVVDDAGRWAITAPTIIDRAEAGSALSPILRGALRIAGVDELLKLTPSESAVAREGSADAGA